MRKLVLRTVRLTLMLATSFCFMTAVYAQDQPNFNIADTSSPRDTLKSFIDACNNLYEIVKKDKYYDRDAPEHTQLILRIIDCLDLSDLPEFARDKRAGEVASCIKEILDRMDLPPWESIPDLKMIEAAGGFEKLSQYRIPGTRITITRVEKGMKKHEYLFSNGTVARALKYFQQVRSKPYRTEGPPVSKNLYQWFITVPGDPTLGAIVQRLPEWMQHGRSYGLANWKWPGLILSLLLAFIVMMIIYNVYGAVRRRVGERSNIKNCLTIVFPIAGALIPLLFLHFCENYLTVRGRPLYIISFFSILTSLLASLAVLFATSNRVAETIISSPRINPQGLNAQLIRIVSKLFSVTASMTIILVGGQYLNVPISTLLASAGIGGIAVALGAQDTLKTIFGTIALMADKPFRVGDRVVFEKYDGVVEDVGLRSTKIRLLAGHMVTLPNDQLAAKNIENLGDRSYLRRNSEINIPLNTPYQKVEKATQIVRDILDNHEGMDPEFPPRIFFDEIGPEAFSIRYMYWYTPADYWEFKAFSDGINFEILRAFDAEGIELLLPSQLSIFKSDQEQGKLDL